MSEEKRQQVIALGRLGWPLRLIKLDFDPFQGQALAAHLLESERREQRFLHKGQGDGVTQSPQHPQGPPGL